MNSAVERAIDCIWERYGEPLSLAEIAKAAILSRFHFSRMFKEATGVSPGRFLSAVRIYNAKRMLVTTSMNVTDISFAVGFNSLGSFTNHFTDSVGVSPSRFRRASRGDGFPPPEPPAAPEPLASRKLLASREPQEPLGPLSPREAYCGRADGIVTGTISLPAGYARARVYLGAFGSPIVQRRPVRAVVAEVTSVTAVSYELTDVPLGAWFINAVAVADSADPEPWTRRALLVGGPDVVTVAAGRTVAPISLRPRCVTDLPILLALPDLEAELDREADLDSVAPAPVPLAPAAGRASPVTVS
jgi:AraC family transcriptional regulator